METQSTLHCNVTEFYKIFQDEIGEVYHNTNPSQLAGHPEEED